MTLSYTHDMKELFFVHDLFQAVRIKCATTLQDIQRRP